MTGNILDNRPFFYLIEQVVWPFFCINQFVVNFIWPHLDWGWSKTIEDKYFTDYKRVILTPKIRLNF